VKEETTLPSPTDVPEMDWEPEVLEAEAKTVRRDAVVGIAVGVGAILLFNLFFGPIFSLVLAFFFGGYAIQSGRDALTGINVYGVEKKYRGVAYASQVLGVVAIPIPALRIVEMFLQS
jgi:hypothetical protein